MKICHVCGTQNQDSARFCAKCGSKLPESQEMPSAQSVTPQTGRQQQPVKKSKLIKILLALCGVLIVVLIVVIVLLSIDDKEETPADNGPVTKVEYDPAFVSGDLSGSESVAPAVSQEPAAVKESAPKSSNVTAHGNIEGYPFSITGNWDGNKFSGNYKNEYNGVKMKCSGQKSGGVLKLTLTSGGSTCSFEFTDLGGGSYTGYFYPGGKSADLQFP